MPVNELDLVVLNGLRARLFDPRWLADRINGQESKTTLVADILRAANNSQDDTDAASENAVMQNLQCMIERVDVKNDLLRISVNLAQILEPDASRRPISAAFDIPFQKRQNGRAKPIVIAPDNAPQPDPDLIALVADARRWAGELLDGKASSIQQITEREGLRSGSVSRILTLAWLAPDISTAILEGRQPPHLSAKSLREIPDLPLGWLNQRKLLGFPHR